MATIQLVIVTPESTTFDESVDSVTLPLVDGEAGVLPGHAPMIGRLGPGELRAQAGRQLLVEENNRDFQIQLEDVLISLKQILTRRSN